MWRFAVIWSQNTCEKTQLFSSLFHGGDWWHGLEFVSWFHLVHASDCLGLPLAFLIWFAWCWLHMTLLIGSLKMWWNKRIWTWEDDCWIFAEGSAPKCYLLPCCSSQINEHISKNVLLYKSCRLTVINGGLEIFKWTMKKIKLWCRTAVCSCLLEFFRSSFLAQSNHGP